jgi:hypothetical protein
MTLKELLDQKATIEANIATLQESCAAVQADIEHMLAGKLAELRKLQGKEFGAINLQFEGYKVTETITKKVDWDQEKLTPLFFKILEAGDKPSDYMRMKLEVPEKLYVALPDHIRTIFDEARTVKGARPTLKFEEVANA